MCCANITTIKRITPGHEMNNEIRPGYMRVSEVVSMFKGCIDPSIEEIVRKKALIGTEVHDLCKRFVCDEEIPEPSSQRVKKYFQCFQEFYIGNKVFNGLYLAEERFYDDDLMITGQVDFLFKTRHGDKCILVDIKTSATPDEFHWWLQGILYANMIRKHGIELVDSFMFVQLKDKDGATPSIFTFPEWKNKANEVETLIKNLLSKRR